MPWTGTLIPVDELERLLAERRRPARRRRQPLKAGRKPALAPELVKRIRAERTAGRSLLEIAAELNADGTPTALGGRQWWPSAVRSALIRSSTSAAAGGS